MLIFVTNRKLCRDIFLYRVEQLANGKPAAIMLREKDMNLQEYENLAIKIKNICDNNQINFIINHNINTATNLGVSSIHLSISELRRYNNLLLGFIHIGASVHSTTEAQEAEKLGATYLIAGHIFSTDCKRGIPPKGLQFLNDICNVVNIPVYAIGGITSDKAADVLNAGAKGLCLMSEAMTCLNPSELTRDFIV